MTNKRHSEVVIDVTLVDMEIVEDELCPECLLPALVDMRAVLTFRSDPTRVVGNWRLRKCVECYQREHEDKGDDVTDDGRLRAWTRNELPVPIDEMTLQRKTTLTPMTPIEGPCLIATQEGTWTLQAGWRGMLAVDKAGYPYPIEQTEYEETYEPTRCPAPCPPGCGACTGDRDCECYEHGVSEVSV